MKFDLNLRWLLLAIAIYLNLNLFLAEFSVGPVRAQPSSENVECGTPPIPDNVQEWDRFEILTQGDRCYRQGDTGAAEQWYRLVKAPLEITDRTRASPDPVYEPEDLCGKRQSILA